MKKVLYIGGFSMPDGNAAAQRVLGIAKILRECQYDVRFCGLQRNIKQKHNGIVEEFTYTNYPYPSSPVNWVKYLTGFDKTLNEIVEYAPDLVILYNHPSLAIDRIRRFCKKRNIKIIADVTEWYEPQGNLIFRIAKGLDTYKRMTNSHKKLDGLICISNYLKDYYNNGEISILNLPPLVDLKQEKWHQSFLESNEYTKLIYAGSPGDNKDRLDLILSTINKFIDKQKKPIIFEVIGLTKEQYQEKWHDKTEYPFVSFLGRIPHKDVINHLLSADFQIFIRPVTRSNQAGFPTKFVESISSKTLPITNLSSNLEEYLKDGINGFIISSFDEKSITLVLDKIFELSKSDIQSLKSKLEVTTFDYRNYIQDFLEFLNKI